MKEITVKNLFLDTVSYEDLIYAGDLERLLQEIKECKTLLLIKYNPVEDEYCPIIVSCNSIISIELGQEALEESQEGRAGCETCQGHEVDNRVLDRMVNHVEDGAEPIFPVSNASKEKNPTFKVVGVSELLNQFTDQNGEFVCVATLPNGKSTTLLKEIMIANMVKDFFRKERMIFCTKYADYVTEAAKRMFAFLDSINYEMSIKDKDDLITDFAEIIIERLHDEQLNVFGLDVKDDEIVSFIIRQYIYEYTCG